MPDAKAREILGRLVVEKRKTRLSDLKEFPRYVIEYLISQFCPGVDFDAELGRVREKLAKNYASPADAPRPSARTEAEAPHGPYRARRGSAGNI